jgi:hypothetical protein
MRQGLFEPDKIVLTEIEEDISFDNESVEE